jgi:hypothetical protein
MDPSPSSFHSLFFSFPFFKSIDHSTAMGGGLWIQIGASRDQARIARFFFCIIMSAAQFELPAGAASIREEGEEEEEAASAAVVADAAAFTHRRAGKSSTAF